MGTTAKPEGLLPFRMKKTDEWMPNNEENRMTDKKKAAMLFRAKYCSSPVFERLSQRSTEASKSLKDSSHNKMDGHGVDKKPNLSSYVTAAGDCSDETAETASTLSSSTSDDNTKSVSDENAKSSATDGQIDAKEVEYYKPPRFPSVHNRGSEGIHYGQYLSRQELSRQETFKMQKESRQKKNIGQNIETSKPPRSRASSPFHDHLAGSDTKSLSLRRAQNHCDVFAEVPKKDHQLCRSPSPLHERLAKHETYATASQRNAKPVPRPAERPFYAFVRSAPRADIEVSSISYLPNSSPLPSRVSPPAHAKMRAPSPIHDRLAMLDTVSSASKKSAVRTLRAPSPRPFYTLVTNGSFTGRDDVSEMTVPKPTPTRQTRQSSRSRHDQVDTRTPSDADDARPRFQRVSPMPHSPTRKSRGLPLSPTRKSRGVSTAKTEQKRKALQEKQNALYHRLATLDTVASSRMKPIPLKQRYIFPSEKKQISQVERNKTPIKRNHVYDRLISRGNNAALKMQIRQASTKYENEHDTFAESCKNLLMRKFEGSTFVRV